MHTESPEGRWRIPAGSPDPEKRPIKCPNFSLTCYEVAPSARHSMCLLPCMLGIHCPGKGSFLVSGFAAGRQSLQAGKPGSVSPCRQEWQHWVNLTDQISQQGCSASLRCRWGHRAGHLHRASPGVWQQGCLSRYVKLVKGSAAQRVQEEEQSFMSLFFAVDQEFRMVCCWCELEHVQTGVLSKRTLGTVLSSLPLPTPVMLCRARKSYYLKV